MNLPQQLAKHFRNVHFGGNWSASNLKDVLQDVTWSEANEKRYEFNTILALTFHINYYIDGVIGFFEGGELKIRDKFSYDHSHIKTQDDWKNLLDKCWQDAERFSRCVEDMPLAKMEEDFFDPKYGNYHSNILGLIEHNHYHLGQIVLIKKMIRNKMIHST